MAKENIIEEEELVEDFGDGYFAPYQQVFFLDGVNFDILLRNGDGENSENNYDDICDHGDDQNYEIKKQTLWYLCEKPQSSANDYDDFNIDSDDDENSENNYDDNCNSYDQNYDIRNQALWDLFEKPQSSAAAKIMSLARYRFAPLSS